MRVERRGHDADGGVVGGRGRGAVSGGGVLGRRRGHGAQAADGGPLRARDHGGGRVAALARMLRGVLRARSGAASHARERRGPRHQGTLLFLFFLNTRYYCTCNVV